MALMVTIVYLYLMLKVQICFWPLKVHICTLRGTNMYLRRRSYSLGGKMKFVREKTERERDLSFVSSKGVLAILY